MVKFVCPHCGADLTRAARALLKSEGQLFTLRLGCECGMATVFELRYEIILAEAKVLDGQKE